MDGLNDPSSGIILLSVQERGRVDRLVLHDSDLWEDEKVEVSTNTSYRIIFSRMLSN